MSFGMKEHPIFILFYLSKKRSNVEGKCPVYYRVTIDGLQCSHATGIFVSPEKWDNNAKKVIGVRSESQPINDKLGKIKVELTKVYEKLSANQEHVTAKMVCDSYIGKNKSAEEASKHAEMLKCFNLSTSLGKIDKKCIDYFKLEKQLTKYRTPDLYKYHQDELLKQKDALQIEIETLISNTNIYFSVKEKRLISLSEVLDEYLLNFLRKVMAGLRQWSTYLKWQDTKDKIRAFSKYRYKTDQIRISDLKLAFTDEFYNYLTIKGHCQNNSAMKHIKNYKQIMGRAVLMEWISTNPNNGFKCTYVEPEPDSLEMQDILKLINAKILSKTLEKIRDAFVFEIFTGFAYTEALNLTIENVVFGPDGKKWLSRERQKTQKERFKEIVPILPIVEIIIEKYKNHECRSKYGRLIPLFTNHYYNRQLKILAKELGINQNLRSHLARHTFATTITLENDVPLPSLSRMLGHKSHRSTERYAKVTRIKISRNMAKVEDKLFGTSGIFNNLKL